MTTDPAPTAAPHDGTRLQQLVGWLRSLSPQWALSTESLRPASNDASFRRYFRIDTANPAHASLIVMDAPPPMEDCRPFVAVARLFAQAGMRVPEVLEADVDAGFLLLSDFGNETYLDVIDGSNADALYADASRALLTIQAASRASVLPEYDRELLLRELMLYPDWYLARHKGIVLSDDDRDTIQRAFEILLANNLAQPRVFVHRDYHSRNLMRLPDGTGPGVLDFQDAVHGPITYDLVSLLRDAYLSWPEERELDWAIRHWERARKASLPVAGDFGDFYRDYEWMGLQRHLKVLGIFARLHHRDGKDRYLDDLPRVLAYVVRTASRYTAFAPLAKLIDRVEGRDTTVGYTF
ncbi:MAG TPA: phosphotransferase [Quisquiliibacterium sp.]|nr:phosphotransferase [Quisquiliibacterium sp.]